MRGGEGRAARGVLCCTLRACAALANEADGPLSAAACARLGGVFRMRLTAKITVLIVVVLIIGFGASTIFTIKRESELARRAEQGVGAPAHRDGGGEHRGRHAPGAARHHARPDPGPQELISRRGPHDLPPERRRSLHRSRDLARGVEGGRAAEGRGRLHREDAPRARPDHDGPAVPACRRDAPHAGGARDARRRDACSSSTSPSPTRSGARDATAPTTRCARWCAWRRRWSRCWPRSRCSAIARS